MSAWTLSAEIGRRLNKAAEGSNAPCASAPRSGRSDRDLVRPLELQNVTSLVRRGNLVPKPLDNLTRKPHLIGI
jgi:hypothetical protein